MEAGLSKISVLWEWIALNKVRREWGKRSWWQPKLLQYILCSNFLGDLDTLGGKNSNTSFSHLSVSTRDRTLASKGKLPLILVESGLKKLCLGLLFLTSDQILSLDVSLVQPGFCRITLVLNVQEAIVQWWRPFFTVFSGNKPHFFMFRKHHFLFSTLIYGTLAKLRHVEILSSSVLPVRRVLLWKWSALICGRAKLWPLGSRHVLTAALSGSFWFLPACFSFPHTK